MPYIKKSVVMFLVSAILGGGAWYLNTTGVIGGVSSSALSTAFSCSEGAIKKQASSYRKVVTRHKKALVIKKQLEAEIVALKVSDPQIQLQKKEATLKILTRQINTYLRFIKKYDTCKTEIKLTPNVSAGIMSGEAKVVVSEKEYQALAAFKIESPKGLTTYLKSIQFKIDVLPEGGIMVDTWFLLHEGADPIACFIEADNALIDCELGGNMPIDVTSDTSRTYGLGAHIATLDGSGTVDIQISKIYFNDGRTYSNTSISSTPLGFGVVAPVVEEVSASTQVATPSTLPVVETPAQTVITPPASAETTTPPATTEVSDPVVQPSAESIVPVSSEAPTSSDIPAVVPVITETQVPAETTPPSSSETTPPPATTEVSDPVVQPSSESVTPPSSVTPPPENITSTTETV